MSKDRLVTPSYVLILAANFLLYFAFYLILPVLPFYLTEIFQTGNAAVGVILSCYTVASLCIRPFSGYLLDTLARKPLYLIAYFLFITVFAGYILAGVLSLFIMLRVVHGLAFGMVTVAGNTIVIDITPSSLPRRSGRLLRTDEQHGHELRTDDRTFYARHLFVRDHLPVFTPLRYSGVCGCLPGKDTC